MTTMSGAVTGALSLCLVAAPHLVEAQGADRVTYFMLLNNDTLGVENVSRSAGKLEGDFLDKLRGVRIRYAATLAKDATVSSTETWVYRGADTTALQHVALRLQGDTMVIDAAAGSPAQRIATQANALVYINPSTALLEQAVMRAKAMGGATAQVPLFQAAGGQTVPLSVTLVGADSVKIVLGSVEMRGSLSPDGRITGLVVPSQNVRVVRVEGTRTTTMEKPDYSAPADAPYTAEEVSFRTPAGIKLTGTLTLPKNRPARGAPAIVTITGSGTEERDESIPGVKGYRPFRQVADTLGRRGIAVLRLDDRGAGGSDMGPPGPTSADFADDIRAALAYLRTRRDIDGDRLGLVGHSEGGMIAPMVAATDARLKAIALMAGPARTGRTIITYQQRYAIDSMQHITGPKRDTVMAAAGRSLDSVAAAQPWLKFFLDYDPLPTAKRVTQPTLVLQGETDRQVTADQSKELATALRAGKTHDVTVRLFPATDHLFLADPNGNPSGYPTLPSKSVRPEVLGALADWLSSRLR